MIRQERRVPSRMSAARDNLLVTQVRLERSIVRSYYANAFWGMVPGLALIQMMSFIIDPKSPLAWLMSNWYMLPLATAIALAYGFSNAWSKIRTGRAKAREFGLLT